jgi:hypothetical protein
MSKVVQVQKPLFNPWLDWKQLPDPVREQALDVLTALYLEIIDVPGLGEQASHEPQAPRALDLDPSALSNMESETDEAPCHSADPSRPLVLCLSASEQPHPDPQ